MPTKEDFNRMGNKFVALKGGFVPEARINLEE